MALKALMLRKKINDKRTALNALIEKDAEFSKREEELEKSIEEVADEESQGVVEEAVAEFESEKKAHDEEKAKLEEEIAELEKGLEEEEAEETEEEGKEEAEEERKENKKMDVRSVNKLDDIVTRDDVKNWLGEVRDSIKNKRALTNVGLTIPEVVIGVLRENVIEYSKLYKHVNVVKVSGEGRQVIMGTIPEAVWTECCANLNELDLAFNDAQVDCHKLGGFYAVCNANLEDSDIDLASEILVALGQSIGRALDKTIIFGTGNGMPLGVATRLAQTSKPDNYPATAREWADLSGNITTISADAQGIDAFKEMLKASGKAKGSYARGSKVWVMNETTYASLMADALTVNANGAIVSGVNDVMPVVGGDIEVLDFIPDDTIVGGYFDLYLLAERAGSNFASSEHYRFLADQTVYKGTARYDGLPVIGEAFVAIGLNGKAPTTNVNFAGDTANNVEGA